MASSRNSGRFARKKSNNSTGGAAYSQQIKDLQQALEVAKVAPGKYTGQNKLADIDSTLSTRGLMQRKLYLMKMMLKNEKQANMMMKEKLDTLGKCMHTDNDLIRGIEREGIL